MTEFEIDLDGHKNSVKLNVGHTIKHLLDIFMSELSIILTIFIK
jgi:hypothetical protein